LAAAEFNHHALLAEGYMSGDGGATVIALFTRPPELTSANDGGLMIINDLWLVIMVCSCCPSRLVWSGLPDVDICKAPLS
jgi:hypothetical protein